MLFNSFAFLIFFPIVTIIYFLLPHRFRWILLLVASCYFYMFFVPVYILILFFTIIIDYWVGILIENAKGKKRKRTYLILSLIANIGVLAFFKYFNFLNENLSILLNNFHAQNPIPNLSILLPIGLSFHTFQAMSYTIEIYKGRVNAERHFGIYALYVMYFPQLVAGPIERPQNVLPQFHVEQRFSYANLIDGLKLMAWGMFKKVVIADRLAVVVNNVNSNVYEQNGLSILISAYFFAFQIYCDFSGYSDIAIGSSRVLGIKLMKNFDRPYSAENIPEFWRRWHISLSTWFRDYLYIPLGGNRVPKWKLSRNILLTFLISGIWHGANWTYIVWGGLHGFYQIFSLMTLKIRNYLTGLISIQRNLLGKMVNIFLTFHLVLFGWIFFRAQNLSEAIFSIKQIGDIKNYSLDFSALGISNIEFGFSIFLIILLEVLQFINSRLSLKHYIGTKNTALRWAVYILFVIFIVIFGEYKAQNFIYFQF